ncbi:MAG: VCBS repeat-containing protein [Planctomycetota bacterium]
MRNTILVLLALGVLICGAVAYAIVTISFTPVQLTEHADLILVLTLNPADDKGNCSSEIKACLKGKKPDKNPVINVTNGDNPEHNKIVKEIIGRLGNAPALLFVGKDERGAPAGCLHLSGKWIHLSKSSVQETWDADFSDSYLVWEGGTDMLIKMVALIIKHPDTFVPEGGNAWWDDPVNIAKVEGKVRLAQAVDITGNGNPSLFVASESGDHVFSYNRAEKKFADVTTKLKLASKSRFVAWGDFDGNGQLDLASSDGKALTLWAQAEDGTFSPTSAADVPKTGCLGLSALDAGARGLAGILWNSAVAPVLLVSCKDKPGAFVLKPLSSGTQDENLGAAGPCLVADFDGDNIPDVMRFFEKGGHFYKGKGGSEFAEAASCPAGIGKGCSHAFLGDWNVDGCLDVFTVAEDACRLWQNEGDGKFVNMLGLSGGIAYTAKPGGIFGNECDFNNDGLQDIFIAYSKQGPQCFFNRGFRSLNHARKPLDLAETDILPKACDGQQAGVLADLTGDGAQDMALVLLNGDVWILPRGVDDETALSVRVSLGLGGYAGPVTVIARNDRRDLGAWVISPGTSEAFLGRMDSGDVVISWRLPQQPPQQKKFDLQKKPIHFVIPAGN